MQLVELHEQLGNVYSDKGEYERAIAHFDTAVNLFTTAGSNLGLANTYANMSAMMNNLNKFVKALEYQLKARDLFCLPAPGSAGGPVSTSIYPPPISSSANTTMPSAPSTMRCI